jgi:hypothetical protein
VSAVQLSLLTAEPVDGWNPYWLAFARSQGKPPADLPGPIWTSRFMAWMDDRWNEWARLLGITDARERRERQDEFGAWLAAEYPEVSS